MTGNLLCSEVDRRLEQVFLTSYFINRTFNVYCLIPALRVFQLIFAVKQPTFNDRVKRNDIEFEIMHYSNLKRRTMLEYKPGVFFLFLLLLGEKVSRDF